MIQPDVSRLSNSSAALLNDFNNRNKFILHTDFKHIFLQKKKFDSADYFTEHEKLKEAAGLGAKKDGEEESKQE